MLVSLPVLTVTSYGSVQSIEGWKSAPWRIFTKELHYKNERFGIPVTPPSIDVDLMQSIEEHGMLNPLLVIRGFDGRVYVWLGNQRLAIARELGMESVSCIAIESAEDIDRAFNNYKE